MRPNYTMSLTRRKRICRKHLSDYFGFGGNAQIEGSNWQPLVAIAAPYHRMTVGLLPYGSSLVMQPKTGRSALGPKEDMAAMRRYHAVQAYVCFARKQTL